VKLKSPSLGTEHRLRVFENIVLKRIFVTEREEATEGYKEFYNEELHNFTSSPNIVTVTRRMR
jgi:hypothetical protein